MTTYCWAKSSRALSCISNMSLIKKHQCIAAAATLLHADAEISHNNNKKLLCSPVCCCRNINRELKRKVDRNNHSKNRELHKQMYCNLEKNTFSLQHLFFLLLFACCISFWLSDLWTLKEEKKNQQKHLIIHCSPV